MPTIPTVRDIAEIAKVSISTVSLALNGKPRVSSATRNRVVSAAIKMGYPISTISRFDNPKKSWRIGIIYPRRVVLNGAITNLCRIWMNGVRQAVAGNSPNLLVFGGSDHFDHDLMLQHVIADRELDGVILIGVTPDDGYLEKVISLELPAVVFNRKSDHDEFSVVGLDNYGAGYVMSNYWSLLGHRKLAILYSTEPISCAADYIKGTKEAFNKNHELVFEAGFDTRLLDDAKLEEICKSVIDSGATAVSVYGDYIAVRCIDIWSKLGTRVPEDLSVMGYDDVDIKTAGGLRCTSVGYDKLGMGKAAGEILLELIEEGSELNNIDKIFKTKVVEGDTTMKIKN